VTEKEVRFYKTVKAIKTKWLDTSPEDTELSENLILDLFDEIEDFLEVPLGN
jgi:hypothetical protein